MDNKELIVNMADIAKELDVEEMIVEADKVDEILNKVAQYKQPGAVPGNFSFKELEGTTWMREIEMTLEGGSVQPNNIPLYQQFFKDLKVYGLNEAITYTKGYEKDGYYQPGTADKLESIKADALQYLKGTMEQKDNQPIVLDEYAIDNLHSVLYKIEDQLPEPVEEELIGKAWVEAFAQAARVPIDVAYVFATNYWTPEALDDEVKQMSQSVLASGRVVLNM